MEKYRHDPYLWFVMWKTLPFVVLYLIGLVLADRFIPYGGYIYNIVLVLGAVGFVEWTKVKAKRLYQKERLLFIKSLQHFDIIKIKSDQFEVLESSHHITEEDPGRSSASLIGKVLDRRRIPKDHIVRNCSIRFKLDSVTFVSPTIHIDKKTLLFRIAFKEELTFYWSSSDRTFFLELTFIDAMLDTNFGYVPMSEEIP